jgi:anti-sigma B factor antagonist
MAATASSNDCATRLHGLGLRSGRDGVDHVLALEGELDMANVVVIEEELRRVEATDCGTIVLDLRRLSFLDSAGIHLLISTHARLSAHGKAVSLLVKDPGPVHRVLDVSGALEILPRGVAAA